MIWGYSAYNFYKSLSQKAMFCEELLYIFTKLIFELYEVNSIKH